MKNWIEVKAVFASPPEDWSPFIEAFDRHGCPETIQTDSPATLGAYLVDLTGAEARVASLRSELVELGATQVDTDLVPEQDWSEMWKEFFKVRRIGKRLVIAPTWESYSPAENDVVVTLDPGQAFGTGDHPTTRLCLELLESAEPAGKIVADVGCGSGILAVAAVKLGANKVVASDIDAQSVEVTKENASLNEVSFTSSVAAGFDALSEPYDIVLSNIISATLLRLAPDAGRFVKVGGTWIVSGIIESNWPDVRVAAEKVGFKLERKVQEDEWVAAAFSL